MVRPLAGRKTDSVGPLGPFLLDHANDHQLEPQLQNPSLPYPSGTDQQRFVDHLGNRIERCEVSGEDVVETTREGPMRLLGKHLQVGYVGARTLIACSSLCGGVVWPNEKAQRPPNESGRE